MSDPLVMCPTCREAVPDRLYYAHQRTVHHPGAAFAPAQLEIVKQRKPIINGSRKMILAGADLSQVEARVEFMLAASTPEFYGTSVGKEFVRLATAHPSEFDIHTFSASVALAKPESEVTDIKGIDQPSERQIGKTTMHGFCRGMGAQTMSDQMLKKGFATTPETCAVRLARLAAKLPAIPEGFFFDVRRQIMRFRGLATTWGGIWRCDWQALGEELYGKGYSFQPQRETADLINQCGFLPLRAAIRERIAMSHCPRERVPRIHVHGHDSLLWSTHPDDVYPVFAYLDRTLGRTTRRYYSGELTVPVTYQIGTTWKPKIEWKKLPDREECRDAAWACLEAA